MMPLAARIAALLVLLPFLISAGEPEKRKVRVTHYGYPDDPHATDNTRLGLGDRDNILNEDSVAVSPDLNALFPFGSRVSVNGDFIGFRHDTTTKNWRNTIAVYDPEGKWKADLEGYVDAQRRKK